MSNLISQLYNKIVNREHVFSKRSAASIYDLILEGATDFTQSNMMAEWVPWTPLQASWYDDLKAQQTFKDESIGPGEVSVAIAILQAAYPAFNDQAVIDDLSKVTQGTYAGLDTRKSSVLFKMVNHEGSASVDIFDIVNKKYYEVKQASEKESVMVGKESRGPALHLYYKIKNDFENLHACYVKLSPEHKALIESSRGPNIKTMTFEKIMNVGHKYFTEKPGELARGCIFQPKKQTSTPKLFLISSFLNEQFFSSPQIKEVIPDAVEYIKMLYGVDTLDARIIDKNIRDHIDRKRKIYSTGEPVEVDAATALSDFVLFAQISIFSSPEKFEKNVSSYFDDGSPESNQILSQIFPNEGIFVVDPKLGYLYAGKQHLASLLRVENITKGIFKVVPRSEPESFENEEEAL